MTKEDDMLDIQALADSLVAAGSPYAYIILDCIEVLKLGGANESERYSQSAAKVGCGM